MRWNGLRETLRVPGLEPRDSVRTKQTLSGLNPAARLSLKRLNSSHAQAADHQPVKFSSLGRMGSGTVAFAIVTYSHLAMSLTEV